MTNKKILLTDEAHKELFLRMEKMDEKDHFNTPKSLKVIKDVFINLNDKEAPKLDTSEVKKLFDKFDNLKDFYNELIELNISAMSKKLDSLNCVAEYCFRVIWLFMNLKQKYPKAPISILGNIVKNCAKVS